MDLMPRSNKGHKYILCIIDEVTNYIIMVPIHHSRLEEIGDALIENIISKYFVSDYVIMDQDSAFMSLLMNLSIQETQYQNKNSGTLQSSIVSGRTWN